MRPSVCVVSVGVCVFNQSRGPWRACVLVYLDCAVYLSDKPEAREESNRPREQEEGHRCDKHVDKVREACYELCHIQLGDEVHYRVQKDIYCGRSRRQERSPPSNKEVIQG